MAPPVTPAEVRFWRHVDREGPQHPILGSRCWLWLGASTTYPTGKYGRFRGHNSRMTPAHRFSYVMAKGPTDAAAMDHLCRVTLCVNPDHLEPVTDRENVLRSPITLAAINAKKTHCPRGHPLDVVWQDRRYCRSCRSRRFRAAHPEQFATSPGDLTLVLNGPA